MTLMKFSRSVARRPSLGLVLGGLAVIVATSGLAVAAIPDQDGVIHACISTDGAVRLIDPSSSDPRKRSCKSTETPLDWNQKGQPGSAGAPGPAGPTGPAGPQGPASPSQCDDVQLVLCLPEDPDLEPRLALPNGLLPIVGESYRLHVKVPIEHQYTSDAQGQPIQVRTVGGPQFGFVLVADLAEEGLEASQWNHDLAQHGLDGNMRDLIFTLHDGATVVARVRLTKSVLSDYRFVGGRVQMTFDVEDMVAEPVS